MNKTKLKAYAPKARKDFIAAVTARANLLGLSDNGGKLEVAVGERKGDIAIIAGREWPVKVYSQREDLIKRMTNEGWFETYMKQSSTGPSRKYYRITDAGSEQLAKMKQEWLEFSESINTFFKEGNNT